MSDTEKFTLKTDSQDFASRLSSVFGEISSLEQNHETWRSNQDSRQSERFWKPEPGEEGSYSLDATFKRPRGFPMKRRLPTLDYVPNFNRNPTKWTKYSLADVPELSNRSNARAALSFLEDRKRQKLEAAELERETLATAKITFHKPKPAVANEQITDTTPDDEPPSTGSARVKGKFVMPECVVGVKDTRVTTSKRIKDRLVVGPTSVSTSIHLQHLDDEENDACEDKLTEKKAANSEKTDDNSHLGFHKFTKKTVKQFKGKKQENAAEEEDSDTSTGTMDCE